MSTGDREAQIRAKLAAAAPMTADQRRAQRVSFAYGNVAIEDNRVTRAMVEAIAKRED